MLAGPDGEAVVLHLVDCSLLSPPSPGPDGRVRYPMLETIRAFGLARLADAGEQDQAAAALAGYAVTVAERAAAGMRTKAKSWPRSAGWMLRTPRCTRAWTGPWNMPRRRRCGWPWPWRNGGCCVAAGKRAAASLLAAARHAAPGSDEWCLAQFWIGDIGPAPRVPGPRDCRL